MRGVVLSCCLLLAGGAARAQTVVQSSEHLSSDRPEAWAMNYLAATTLPTSFGADAPPPWRWSVAAEVGHVPHLSERQRRVGFIGTKVEDLNRTPVFGRVRAALGLPAGFSIELAYTPPLAIDGVRPYDLVAAAIGRRWLQREAWSLATRVFGQHGAIKGDITCPAALAGVADPARNPSACQAPSRDRQSVDYYGVDATAGWHAGAWHGHAGLGVVRTELAVQVDALTRDFRDRTLLIARGARPFFTAGVRRDLGARWSVAAEVLHVPLQVRREIGAARESDPLTSVRVQVRYQGG